MAKISDSSGAKVDLKENKNATLWRRFSNFEGIPDAPGAFDGYVMFFRLLPRGADPVEVTNITVVNNTVEVEFDTTDVPNRCDYVFGWTDPSGKIEVIQYGMVLIV